MNIEGIEGQTDDQFNLILNVRSNRARVHDFLKRKGTERLDWPALSPDVIPTERMWNELKVDISSPAVT